MMTPSEKALYAIDALKKEYPDAVCSLNEKQPFRLLVAVRLSAQCTDKRVNEITPVLFEKYPTVGDMADADVSEVEKIVKPCGFYHQKAHDIVFSAKKILSDFDGKVPDTIEKLVTLPGVGRKTANLIVGDIYGGHAVVCDTHFMRIMTRLGFADKKDPEKIEKIMRPLLPPDESSDFCHRCVLHGRAVCKSQNPECGRCVLAEICNKLARSKEQGAVD